MTPEGIDQKKDGGLTCKYVEAHDPNIPYELYKLAREFEKIRKELLN